MRKANPNASGKGVVGSCFNLLVCSCCCDCYADACLCCSSFCQGACVSSQYESDGVLLMEEEVIPGCVPEAADKDKAQRQYAPVAITTPDDLDEDKSSAPRATASDSPTDERSKVERRLLYLDPLKIVRAIGFMSQSEVVSFASELTAKGFPFRRLIHEPVLSGAKVSEIRKRLVRLVWFHCTRNNIHLSQMRTALRRKYRSVDRMYLFFAKDSQLPWAERMSAMTPRLSLYPFVLKLQYPNAGETNEYLDTESEKTKEELHSFLRNATPETIGQMYKDVESGQMMVKGTEEMTDMRVTVDRGDSLAYLAFVLSQCLSDETKRKLGYFCGELLASGSEAADDSADDSDATDDEHWEEKGDEPDDDTKEDSEDTAKLWKAFVEKNRAVNAFVSQCYSGKTIRTLLHQIETTIGSLEGGGRAADSRVASISQVPSQSREDDEGEEVDSGVVHRFQGAGDPLYIGRALFGGKLPLDLVGYVLQFMSFSKALKLSEVSRQFFELIYRSRYLNKWFHGIRRRKMRAFVDRSRICKQTSVALSRTKNCVTLATHLYLNPNLFWLISARDWVRRSIAAHRVALEYVMIESDEIRSDLGKTIAFVNAPTTEWTQCQDAGDELINTEKYAPLEYALRSTNLDDSFPEAFRGLQETVSVSGGFKLMDDFQFVWSKTVFRTVFKVSAPFRIVVRSNPFMIPYSQLSSD